MADTPRLILHNDDTAALVTQLRAAFPDVSYRVCHSYDALPELIGTFCPEVVYSVRFAGTPGYPAQSLFGPDGPRWVANGGAGTDHFGTWDPARVTVTNAAGVAADMMAEYVLAGFMHFALDVPGMRRDQAARIWDSARMVSPLKGKTVLIVGLGHTGRAIAVRAKAFGMTVFGTRATPRPTNHVDAVHPASELASLLPLADFVAIATPLIPSTRALIGAAEIATMKPGVILADVSRGGVVDQSALADALRAGHVAGAALDVFDVEPLPNESPLWGMDRVLVSPHCASVHDGWQEASFALFLDNLAAWIDGRPLRNIVDPARGY